MSLFQSRQKRSGPTVIAGWIAEFDIKRRLSDVGLVFNGKFPKVWQRKRDLAWLGMTDDLVFNQMLQADWCGCAGIVNLFF